jgi:hypothetical protein
MLRFSRRPSPIRDLTPMLSTFHLIRPIYSSHPSTPLTLDGKPILASYKSTMLNMELTATPLTLLKHPLILRRNFLKPITLSLQLGKRLRNINHMLPPMPSLIVNYQKTLTGDKFTELISQTHIEIKDIVDLAILCLLLRSLR